MASTFRILKAPLNMRSWLSYPAELPLAQRKAASQTAPEVAGA
jgi:hypothetical protein